MIVYRVACGAGWTADTHAFITSTKNADSAPFGQFSAFHAPGSTAFSEETGKIEETSIHFIQDVFSRTDGIIMGTSSGSTVAYDTK